MTSPAGSPRPLRLLVLGGTAWLGGTVARHAHDRGHAVTCLARGVSGDVPDGVRWVQADRTRDDAYAEVVDGDWDAVLDVSWQPALVRSALSALASSARQWIYVSSISVYRDDAGPLGTTTHPPWTGSGEAGIEDYAAAKVACEAACRAQVAADRLLVARAGLIGGYGDPTDRFGYWPARYAAATSDDEAVLVPTLASPVQVIDVADLASWLVHAAEHRAAGTFDVAGDRHTLADVVAACEQMTGRRLPRAEAGDDWLMARGVGAWAGPDSLPLWLPGADRSGVMARDNGSAVHHGLAVRPLTETVRSSLRWEQERGLGRSRRAGLRRERERELVGELTTR